jgi:hypothetical protein
MKKRKKKRKAVDVEQEEKKKTIQARRSYTSIIQVLSYQHVPVDIFFCKDVMNFKFQREPIYDGRLVNITADMEEKSVSSLD